MVILINSIELVDRYNWTSKGVGVRNIEVVVSDCSTIV